MGLDMNVVTQPAIITDFHCKYCEKNFNYRVAQIGHERSAHREEYYKENPNATKKWGGRPKGVPNKLKGTTNPNVFREKEEETPELQKAGSISTQKSLRLHKSAQYTAEDLNKAEILLKHGIAKDFNDLQSKALDVVFDHVRKYGELPDNKPLPTKSIPQMLEDMKRQELEELQIEDFKNKIQKQKKGGGNKMDTSDLIVMMMMMNQNKPQDSFAQAMEIAKYMGQNGQQTNMRDVIEIARLINPPQNNQMETMKTMMEMQRNGNNVTDILKAVNSREKEMMERNMELEKLRQEASLGELRMEIKHLNEQFNQPKSQMDVESIGETIKAIKSISEELGGGGKKPSTLDYMESLGRNFGPAVTEFIKAKSGGQSIPRGAQRFAQEEDDETTDEEDNTEEAMDRARQMMTQQRIIPHPQMPQMHQHHSSAPNGSAMQTRNMSGGLLPKTPPEVGYKPPEYAG